MRFCHFFGLRLAWKQAMTSSVSSSSITKNNEYGNRLKRARRTFLSAIGNCRGFALMRSTRESIAARKRRPSPETLSSYQSCASINSARAAGVKMTGSAMGNAALVRPSMRPTLLRRGGLHRGRRDGFQVRFAARLSRGCGRGRGCPKAARSTQGVLVESIGQSRRAPAIP
jgi:hypothetical protein